MVKVIQFLVGLLPIVAAAVARKSSDPGADQGQAPAIPVTLDQHHASPPSGLSMMGIYSTNFGETPYCCPWNPKQYEVDPPLKGWGVVPMICQVADAGTNGFFNANGTVLVGDSWIFTNGSVAYFGHAGSRNGAYYFGFAMTPDRTTLNGFFTFQDQLNGPMDGGVLTGPWIWTYLREPTPADCAFALRETADTISPLSGNPHAGTTNSCKKDKKECEKDEKDHSENGDR